MWHRPTSALGGAAVALLLISCGASPTTPTPPAQARRLLVVTHTAGFRHASIPTAETVIARIGQGEQLFAPIFARNASDVARHLAPSGLANVDGVIFANTTGNLGIADLPAFLSWVRDGHPFIGVHSAADTYHDEPEYLTMLGGQFAAHGQETAVEIRVEQPAHPAGSLLPAQFRIFDEIYLFRSNPRPHSTIVLSLDRHPDDGMPSAGQPGDFPLAWYRSYGAGRVFYTALGHRDDVWNDPRFQDHLDGAIRWAFGIQ